MAASKERRSIPRLSDSQKKNLTDCLSASLTRQLNLTDLAGLFNLSPRQFFRLFCNSFGMTPITISCMSACVGPRSYYQPDRRRPRLRTWSDLPIKIISVRCSKGLPACLRAVLSVTIPKSRRADAASWKHLTADCQFD
jgi:AraC-like DNA-binding protein